MSISEKLTTIANNVPLVFNAGKDQAYSDFWDSYQQNGVRTNYNSAFSGYGWNNTTFKPKYNINVTSFARTFAETKIAGSLKQLLTNLNISFDFSRCVYYSAAFQNATSLTELPQLGGSAVRYFTNAFDGCTDLETIQKLIVNSDCEYTYAFRNCVKLKNIVFEGTVAKNIDLSASKVLSKESIKSLLEACNTPVSNVTIKISQFYDDGTKNVRELFTGELNTVYSAAMDNGYTVSIIE